jgi:hypothetical protein
MPDNLNCFMYSSSFFNSFRVFGACRLEIVFARKSSGQRKNDQKKDDDLNSEADQDDLFVERLRLEKMDLRLYAVFCQINPPLSSMLMNGSLRKVKLNDEHLTSFLVMLFKSLY